MLHVLPLGLASRWKLGGPSGSTSTAQTTGRSISRAAVNASTMPPPASNASRAGFDENEVVTPAKNSAVAVSNVSRR